MDVLIAKKTHQNAQAFVRVRDNKAQVFGKFGGGYSGPFADVEITVPEELRMEIAVNGSYKKQHSDELNAFCDDCFRKAAEDDSWFRMFLPEE